MQIDVLKSKVKNFIESKWFIVLLSILTFLCWLTPIYLLSTIFMVIALALILWSGSNMVSIISVYMLYFAGKSEFSMGSIKTPENITCISIIFILGLAAIIFAILDIKKNFKIYKNKLLIDKFFISTVAILLYMAITIVNSPIVSYSIGSTLKNVLIFFAFILAELKIPKDDNTKDTLIFSLVLSIFVIFSEFCVRFIYVYNNYEHLLTARSHMGTLYFDYVSLDEALSLKELGLFWAVSNHYIIVVNMALIASVYYIFTNKDNKKKILSAFAIVLALIMNYFDKCRAGYLALLASFAAMAILLIVRNKDKRTRIIIYSSVFSICVIAVLALVIIVTPEKIVDLFKKIGTNRSTLYSIAWAQFKEHITFGTGIGSSYYYLVRDLISKQTLYNYHNYILQILSTMGIIGFGLFLYHLSTIIIKIWGYKSHNIMLIAVLTYFLINGLFDSIFFEDPYMIWYFILISVFCKTKNSDLNKIYYLY